MSPPHSPKVGSPKSSAQSPHSSAQSFRARTPAPADAADLREAFHWLLLRKHHSIISAWRVLDPLGHGRLSFFDFCRAATTLGCLCDTRKLWEALDIHQVGFISLHNVDPALARLLGGFSLVASRACGSAAAAWKQHFSSAGSMGRCSLGKFVRAARAMGYGGDAEAVHDALNADKTPSGVSFKEFAMLDKWFKPILDTSWDYERLRPINFGGFQASGFSKSAPDLRLPVI